MRVPPRRHRVGDYLAVLKDLFPHTGNAWVLGVTGNPGAGKIALGGEITRAGAHDRSHRVTGNQGVDELLAMLELHRAWLATTELGAARRAARLAESMRTHLREALIDEALRTLGDRLDRAVAAVGRREIDPYSAAERLVAEVQGR